MQVGQLHKPCKKVMHCFTVGLELSQFYKISEPLIDGQTQFVCTQRNELFCFSDYQNWCKILQFWLSSVMLHFKDQLFPTYTEEDLRLCTEGPGGHNILTHYCGLM